VYALLNASYQVELPDTTLELPCAQRDKQDEEQNRKRPRYTQE
jgi:hypothetical protein